MSRRSLMKISEDRQFLKKALPPNFSKLYKPIEVIGRGSFGVVFSASTADGRIVAVKQVLEDPNIKYREHEVLLSLDHRNLLQLHDFFMIQGPRPRTRYLNYVTDYFPMTLKQFWERNEADQIFLKLFTFQALAGLAYLHGKRIVHRDISPENMFVDPVKGTLVIGDFSEAKRLRNGERNTSYLVSRPYRAPELIYGSETYDTAIDVWAIGCILAQMALKRPLFKGSSELSQLNSIVDVLGPPDEGVVVYYRGNKRPNIPKAASTSLDEIFRGFRPELVSLLKQMLVYDPRKRVTAKESLLHPFFNELFRGSAILPSGQQMPPLYRGDIDFLHSEEMEVE